MDRFHRISLCKVSQSCLDEAYDLTNRCAADEPVACAPTPDGIKYNTPSSLVESPRIHRTEASQSHNLINERNEQPFYLDTKPVGLDLSRTTISDLNRLLNTASRAESAGKLDEANAEFRDAVSGFRFLLSPTHEDTLRAGYRYAFFYANCAKMDEADAVLNWMSKKHVERWGSKHEKTYLHYTRMIQLLRSWGRKERAELLVYKLLDDTRNDDIDCLFDLVGERPGSQHRTLFADSDLEQALSKTDDPDSLSHQLDKIDLAIMTDITGLDNALEVIVRVCEDKPDDMRMSLQACRAKCALAKLYHAAGRVKKTQQVLVSAKKSLEPLLLVGEEPVSRTTIDIAKRLSYLFFEEKDESSCTDVLDEVIASLEARRHVPDYEHEVDDAFLLDFIQEIAFHFHELASWDICRYWMERGLNLATRLHGRKSSKARRFQAMLNKGAFTMRTPINVHDLMKSSEGSFIFKVV